LLLFIYFFESIYCPWLTLYAHYVTLCFEALRKLAFGKIQSI